MVKKTKHQRSGKKQNLTLEIWSGKLNTRDMVKKAKHQRSDKKLNTRDQEKTELNT